METRADNGLDTPLVPVLIRRGRNSQFSRYWLSLTYLLSSLLLFPGLIVTFESLLDCSPGFSMWLQALAGTNIVTICVLLGQSFSSRNSRDRYMCLALGPAPFYVLELMIDFVGVCVVAKDWESWCRWMCMPMVLVSLGKMWIHCFYSTTVMSQGCERYGMGLCQSFMSSENVYGKCPICNQTITPGQEIADQKCPNGHLFHLTCSPCPLDV